MIIGSITNPCDLTILVFGVFCETKDSVGNYIWIFHVTHIVTLTMYYPNLCWLVSDVIYIEM